MAGVSQCLGCASRALEDTGPVAFWNLDRKGPACHFQHDGVLEEGPTCRRRSTAHQQGCSPSIAAFSNTITSWHGVLAWRATKKPEAVCRGEHEAPPHPLRCRSPQKAPANAFVTADFGRLCASGSETSRTGSSNGRHKLNIFRGQQG